MRIPKNQNPRLARRGIHAPQKKLFHRLTGGPSPAGDQFQSRAQIGKPQKLKWVRRVLSIFSLKTLRRIPLLIGGAGVIVAGLFYVFFFTEAGSRLAFGLKGE